MESAHPVAAEDRIYVVEQEDVLVHVLNDAKITLRQLVLPALVWHRALCRDDLRHVIVAHVLQGFAVVFSASADELVEITNEPVLLIVHLH